MNKHTILGLALGSLFSPFLMADDLNYWQCTAHDAQNKQWTVSNSYQLTAINKAFDACKKASQIPGSCKSSREDCDFFLHGVSTRPMWQCPALDAEAKVWRSNIYIHADDAALAAKAYCHSKSDLPDTCYTYLFMCRNLNSRDR